MWESTLARLPGCELLGRRARRVSSGVKEKHADLNICMYIYIHVHIFRYINVYMNKQQSVCMCASNNLNIVCM